MYAFVKKMALAFLKVPPEPEDPMGDVGTLVVFRASPNFFKYRLILWILKNVLGALGYIVIAGVVIAGVLSHSKGTDLESVLILVLVAVLLVFFVCQLFVSYAMLRLDYEMRWYKVTDRSLRIREGVMFVREMTMTFANIQNISVSQGPIQRMFGIADLRVETAGGGGAVHQANEQHNMFSMHVGFFRGVDNVEKIKTLMLERLKKYRDSGLGDTDDSSSDILDDTKGSLPANSSFIEALKAVAREVSTLRSATEKLPPMEA